MAGRLIICEGGEGSGKSTLIKNLKERLEGRGETVRMTREPGGTPFAEELRESLIKKRATDEAVPSPRAELVTFYAARFDHIEKVIIPALERGETVLCDRFELSTYVYQVHTKHRDLHTLFCILHDQVARLLAPYDVTYILCDIDPEIGLERVGKRGDDETRFDAMDTSFHNKVRQGMLAGPQFFSSHFTFYRIDASQSPELVLGAAYAIVTETM